MAALHEHRTDPQVISHCEKEMKVSDIACTLAATTIGELVAKCHWKAAQGPRGISLSWE